MIATGLVLLLRPPFSSAQAPEPFCKLGEEKWIAGCETSCQANWEGTSPRSCDQSCTATPPLGTVIVNHRVSRATDVNGSYTVSRISSDQRFDYKKEVERAYNYTLELAGQKRDTKLKGRIQEDKKQAVKEAENFTSTHQLLRLAVHAETSGTVVDRRGGSIAASVEMQVRCFAPGNLQQQVARRYGLGK
jgi:hypothetical protein